MLSVSAYDLENRLAGQSRAGLVVQTLRRDAQGNVIEQSDALNRTTRIDYDKANRKIRQASAGAVENWTYSPLGDVEIHVDADRRTTTNTYDERRFLRSESLAGETTRYDYDGSGRRIRLQRPNGEASTWTYAYDTAGRLFTVTDPLLHVTTFGYDANDNRTSVRDANQQLTLFHYDERNRLSGKTYPGGSAAWAWGYDADNNRIHSESPNGRSNSTDYDALNRPTLTTYTAAPAGEVQDTTRSYDGNGNLLTISETDSSGTRTETRDYDDFDRMIHVVDGDGRGLTYRYDDVGNRTHRADADGQETVWTYDALNHNTHIYVPGQGTTAQTHTPTGRLETLTRPDGSTTTHTYTDAGRIASITHARSGTTLASYSYAYDANGNRLEQQETNGAASGGVTQRTGYIYDDADRLTEVEEPGWIFRFMRSHRSGAPEASVPEGVKPPQSGSHGRISLRADSTSEHCLFLTASRVCFAGLWPPLTRRLSVLRLEQRQFVARYSGGFISSGTVASLGRNIHPAARRSISSTPSAIAYTRRCATPPIPSSAIPP